jgi:hypothetical protein
MTKLAARTAIFLVLAGAGTGAILSASGGDSSGSAEASPAPVPAAKVTAVPKRPPVLLLIFDEWPLNSLLGADGHIDAGRYPNIAALANTATWFPNASTVYDSTTRAVPEILDAQYPRASATPDYKGHPHTIFDVFGKHHYRIVESEEATAICPPRYCHHARSSRPGILKALQNGRRERFEDFLSKIRPSKTPTLFVRHTLLPHGPYLFLPSGKQTRHSWRDPINGMNSPPGFNDEFLTEHNEQRLRLQAGFVDHELGKLFAQMKRDGTFDKTLIAITPDHGIATELHVKDRRTVTKSNIDEIAPIPVFIKAPGQTKGKIDRAYIRTIDIVPTIADIVNFKMPYKADGRSAFSAATRRRHYVRMIKRDFSGSITVSGASLEGRRNDLLRKELRLFGSGNWPALFTGIGPNRGLIGKSVAAVPQLPAAKVRANINQAADIRNVNLNSVVVPSQITGAVTGGAKGEHHDLAVAVNGRIEAVGRTFYLIKSKTENFAMMTPETAFKGGRNSVQVFDVVGGKLRPLGAV